MALYVGIDGGGTKTKFLLGDEEQVLAEATASGTNLLRVGEGAAREALHAGLSELCTKAGISPEQIVRIVAGLAGSSNLSVKAACAAILQEKVAADVRVVGDMEIAHEAAFAGAAGVLVNAGTGSIAFGKNEAGETARAGGWGAAISDEGSGHWIGRLAIVTAMRCFDSSADTGYLHHLTAAMGLTSVEELAAFATATSAPKFADVFPAVLTIAKLGDETAQQILRHAGQELAYLAETVIVRIFAGAETIAVAAVGGVVQSSELVFEAFQKDVAGHHANSTISLSQADPALGALQMARRQP